MTRRGFFGAIIGTAALSPREVVVPVAKRPEVMVGMPLNAANFHAAIESVMVRELPRLLAANSHEMRSRVLAALQPRKP